MKKLSTLISIVALLIGLGVSAAAALTFTPLVLVNGWVGGGFSTAQPSVTNTGGIVHFKGTIENGTAPQAFTLPAGFRPSHVVYVAVDMCNATNGRLIINPNGVTSVQAEASFSNAQCFTSLEGASFAQ
jgi:hypothetical protein